MNRLLAAAFVAIASAVFVCAGISATTSAEEKGAQQPAGPAYDRILRELNNPTEVDFIETPLKDVVEALRIRHQIQIQIDTKAITDAGSQPDSPITLSVKGVSLRSALRLMLREHGLDFVLTDEVVLITSAENPAMRQYDVADLLSEENSIDALADAVRFALPRAPTPAAMPMAPQLGGSPSATVRRAGGGFGSVPEQISTADGEVTTYGTRLLVRASDRGHMNVSTLLEEMRHGMRPIPHKPAPQAASY